MLEVVLFAPCCRFLASRPGTGSDGGGPTALSKSALLDVRRKKRMFFAHCCDGFITETLHCTRRNYAEILPLRRKVLSVLAVAASSELLLNSRVASSKTRADFLLVIAKPTTWKTRTVLRQ